MAFNTTQVSGSQHRILTPPLQSARPAVSWLNSETNTNLGYGLGRMLLKISHVLSHTWRSLWKQGPSDGEMTQKRKESIYRTGLLECVKELELAIVNLSKNPVNLAAFERLHRIVKTYRYYLEPSDQIFLRDFQKKSFQFIKEKLAKMTHPSSLEAVKSLLPMLFEPAEFPHPPERPSSIQDSHSLMKRSTLQSVPAYFNLSALNGSIGFTILDSNLAANAWLGTSVAGTGDLNEDGIADLVLSAPFALHGSAFVLFGQSSWSSVFDLASLSGTTGFEFDGLATNDQLGTSVAGAGDINKDGIQDLVLGALGASGNAGAAYVIFGQMGGWSTSLSLQKLNGTNGFVVPAIGANSQLGGSVSGIGDINGDSVDDLALGAGVAAPGGLSVAGSVYILFGQNGTWPSPFNLALLDGTNGFVVDGPAIATQLGSVGKAGDINQDGIDDLVLGAVGSSSVYVIFGQRGIWPSLFNLTALNGTNGFVVTSLGTGDQLGISVSGAGDVNHDGVQDLIFGAYASAAGGSVYVLFGQPGTWLSPFNVVLLNGTNGFAINNIATSGAGSLGYSVSGAGDMNNDGISDIAFTSIDYATYVIFGRQGQWPSSFNLMSLDGSNGFAVNRGFSVSRVQDINRDGISDLIIGDRDYSSYRGAAYVIFGQNSSSFVAPPSPTPNPLSSPGISMNPTTAVPAPTYLFTSSSIQAITPSSTLAPSPVVSSSFIYPSGLATPSEGSTPAAALTPGQTPGIALVSLSLFF